MACCLNGVRSIKDLALKRHLQEIALCWLAEALQAQLQHTYAFLSASPTSWLQIQRNAGTFDPADSVSAAAVNFQAGAWPMVPMRSGLTRLLW